MFSKNIQQACQNQDVSDLLQLLHFVQNMTFDIDVEDMLHSVENSFEMELWNL